MSRYVTSERDRREGPAGVPSVRYVGEGPMRGTRGGSLSRTSPCERHPRVLRDPRGFPFPNQSV